MTRTLKRSVILLLFFISSSFPVMAQMERERATDGNTVEETFWTPAIVGMGTVQTLQKKNLNVTIMHNFGLVNQQTLRNFLGMDLGATVRLGLDYGITDHWSVGVGRTSPFRVYDLRTTWSFLQQITSPKIPLSIALKADIAVNTNRNSFDFNDRLNYFTSLMVARKFNNHLSFQLVPMYAHFNKVASGDVNNHFAIGIGGQYRLSRRWAIIAEYYPVIGKRSAGTKNAFAIGVDIETGGHVFQLFLKSSQWHNEQYIISQNNDDFWAGDFRFGFNVNRLFLLGG